MHMCDRTTVQLDESCPRSRSSGRANNDPAWAEGEIQDPGRVGARSGGGEQGIILKPAAPLEAGPVVGEEAYKRILRDLESLRKKWR